MKKFEFVIIGAGTAGLSAAIVAAKRGVDVTIIDENPYIGGQIFRQMPPELQSKVPLSTQDKDIFVNLKEGFGTANVRHLRKTTVWGIFEEKTIATDNPEYPLIQADKILIASGVYETPFAIPGWTLPGVMVLGGVQILLKSQGVIPEGRMLVAGTGPFLYLAASQLIKQGANVVEVLEASSRVSLMKRGMQLWRYPALAWKGLEYLSAIRKHKVRIRYNMLPVEARGGDKLEEVVAARVDDQWNPLPGGRETFKVDCLGLNYGFTPSTELTHTVGCEHECHPEMRCWTPKYNDSLETTQPGIFVAGDCVGVGGVKTAILEGEIVGTEVARQLKRFTDEEAMDKLSNIRIKLARYDPYKKILRKIYEFRPGLLKLLTDDTLVCRCEEIDFKGIKDAIENKGVSHIEPLKRLLRTGMGRCQGRFCYPTLLGIISGSLGIETARRQDFSARPPVRPLPLKVVLDMAMEADKIGTLQK